MLPRTSLVWFISRHQIGITDVRSVPSADMVIVGIKVC
jgi:hypothetical protein